MQRTTLNKLFESRPNPEDVSLHQRIISEVPGECQDILSAILDAHSDSVEANNTNMYFVADALYLCWRASKSSPASLFPAQISDRLSALVKVKWEKKKKADEMNSLLSGQKPTSVTGTDSHLTMVIGDLPKTADLPPVTRDPHETALDLPLVTQDRHETDSTPPSFPKDPLETGSKLHLATQDQQGSNSPSISEDVRGPTLTTRETSRQESNTESVDNEDRELSYMSNRGALVPITQLAPELVNAGTQDKCQRCKLINLPCAVTPNDPDGNEACYLCNYANVPCSWKHRSQQSDIVVSEGDGSASGQQMEGIGPEAFQRARLSPSGPISTDLHDMMSRWAAQEARLIDHITSITKHQRVHEDRLDVHSRELKEVWESFRKIDPEIAAQRGREETSRASSGPSRAGQSMRKTKRSSREEGEDGEPLQAGGTKRQRRI